MIRSTFQHLEGIGPRTEAFLWSWGIRTWEDLRQSRSFPGMGMERVGRLHRELQRSEEALVHGDAGYFARRLPPSEHWRLYSTFASRTAFLDIETTGLYPGSCYVTVVTVHGGGETRTFVRGEDLEELGAHLRRFALLVTFNGSLFDVPFLEATFPHLPFPPAHADLRFLLRRLGQKGGLKIIEKRLGLGSRDGVEGVDGQQSIRLWQDHLRGVRGSLERLVAYNRADAVNLEPLLEYASREMERRLLRIPSEEVIPDPTSERNVDPVQLFLNRDP
jgi:uncharacterized protein YprB with RNaseH-like and TPR domain